MGSTTRSVPEAEDVAIKPAISDLVESARIHLKSLRSAHARHVDLQITLHPLCSKAAATFRIVRAPDPPSRRHPRTDSLGPSASLRLAAPSGVYVSLAPGDPTLWNGVIFVRSGDYELNR